MLEVISLWAFALAVMWLTTMLKGNDDEPR